MPGERGGDIVIQNSLASKINGAIASFPAASPAPQQQKPQKVHPSSSFSSNNLVANVASKLAGGDIHGAIRLAASDDTMLCYGAVQRCQYATAAVLRMKHPVRAVSSIAPPTSSGDACLCLHQDGRQAIPALVGWRSWSDSCTIRNPCLAAVFQPSFSPSSAVRL